MFKVGITGNIGSGKTLICKIFETLGTSVYYADDRAKHLMNHHPQLRQLLIENFGEIVFDNGVLNKSLLSKAVYNFPEKLQLLNSLVHPIVIQDGVEWMEAHQSEAYIIKEAAIMFESNTNKLMDYIVGIRAEKLLRMKRIQQRSGLSEAAIEKIMATQMEESKKMDLCNYVISNNEDSLVLPIVLQLHETFLTGKGI